MCTVSFVPTKDAVYLTSNRDEKARRKPALPPQWYRKNTCDMYFPEDGDAHGSWITVCSNGNAGVLLNGAFANHWRKETYAKSRGVVLLEIMDHPYPLYHFSRYPLNGVEPFTLILRDDNKLFECRWDEKQKHYKPLKAYRPYIWSSVTLYDADARRKREYWFAKFLNRHPQPSQDDVLHFHLFAGEGDEQNNLLMNRHEKIFTVSVTSLALTDNGHEMRYLNVDRHTSASRKTFDEQLRA